MHPAADLQSNEKGEACTYMHAEHPPAVQLMSSANRAALSLVSPGDEVLGVRASKAHLHCSNTTAASSEKCRRCGPSAKTAVAAGANVEAAGEHQRSAAAARGVQLQASNTGSFESDGKDEYMNCLQVLATVEGVPQQHRSDRHHAE
jgi:hypothetical protein